MSSANKVMDLSVDPCENFYKFSCGNWSQLNPLPSPSTQVNNICYTYKYPCLKYPLDTGQLEILLQLCLSPKLGGFYKRGEIVFAKQTQADMPPFLTYFMPRHTTLHTTLEQFLHFQTPTHLYLILLCFSTNPPATITNKIILFQHWTNFVKLDRANLALLRRVLERPSQHLPRLLPR